MKALNNTLKIAVGVFLLAGLAVSCVPEQESMGDAGQTLVAMYTPSSDGYYMYAIDAVNTSQTVVALEVRKNCANSTDLNTRTTVNFQLDDASNAMLNAYNDAYGTDFSPFPAGTYVFSPAPSSNKISVVFEPGDFAKEVSVTIPNALALDMSKQYGFCMKASIEGTGLWSTGTNDTLLVQVMPKNQYDGLYNSTGSFNHPASGGEGWAQDDTYDRYFEYTGADAKEGITSGASSIFCWAGDVGYDMQLTVLGTTIDVGGHLYPQVKVDILTRPDYGQFTLTEAPEEPGLPCNYYNTDTKTFVLYYYYGSAPNRRKIYEELTYAGER